MNVFISIQIPQAGIDLLEAQGYTVTVNRERRALSETELIDRCADQDALLYANSVKLTDRFFSRCKHLKIVALMSAGYDQIPVDIAKAYGVPVSNTPDVLSNATADIALFLMMAASRNAFRLSQQISRGEWGFALPTEKLGIELYGKTLGIFGLGRIGFETAKKAQALYDMKIIYHNRAPRPALAAPLDAEYVDFDTLVTQSDVLSAHTGLTDETRGKFDREVFRKMKPSALFINTGRGGLHNEEDLIEALKSGEIWGAGLDVTNPEPMHPDNPLLTMNNVCVLPHIGSATVETRDAMALTAARNVIAALKGEKIPQEITG